MILIDTSLWIDHLNAGDPGLETLLSSGQVLVHPFVIGEIALGRMRRRDVVLGQLSRLPKVDVATDAEVVRFIEDQKLSGSGIGYVDAHLLASTRLAPDTFLWTRDRRLLAIAERLGLAN